MTLNIEPETAVKLSFAIISLPTFFWVRGIVKSCKSDLIFGFTLLCLAIPVAMSLGYGVGGAIGGFGFAMALLGLATFIASFFAKPNCPLQKRDRSAIAIGFVIIGLFLSSVII